MKRRSSLFLFLIILTISFILLNCYSSPTTSSKNWRELRRLDLDYAGVKSDSLHTTDRDMRLISETFRSYLGNASLARVRSEVHIGGKYKHQLIITEYYMHRNYVDFSMFSLNIVYSDFTISYDFINSRTVGAARWGEENGFVDLYSRGLDPLGGKIRAEIRMLENQLSRSKDPIVELFSNALKKLIIIHNVLDSSVPIGWI